MHWRLKRAFTSFDVPLEMAVEELDARVVGDPSQRDGAASGDTDGVAAHGALTGRL